MMSKNSSDKQIKPLVSIIIPFFNTGDFLSEAVESVLAQTVEDWELILVDDGSTDNTVEIAREFVKKYPHKIFLLSHKNNQNKGAHATRHLGFANSNGKYFILLDSDDILFPDAIEKELKAFAKNPEADVVCGNMECWFSWSENAENREKDFIIDLVLETDKLYQPPNLLIHNLTAGGRKPGTDCIMIKSEFARKIKIFEQEYRYTWDDQVIWAKLSLHGKIYVMNAVVIKYRQHLTSISATQNRTGQDVTSQKIFLDWLKSYLHEQNVENEDIWKSLENYRRRVYRWKKLWKIKQIYRRIFPFHIRYKIRDKLTQLKRILLRSAHRHK